MDMWIRSFGTAHVLTRTPILRKLELIMKDYNTQVYTKVRRKTKHPSNKPHPLTSVRILNKEWRRMQISDRDKKRDKSGKNG